MLKKATEVRQNVCRTGQNQPSPEPNRNFGRFVICMPVYARICILYDVYTVYRIQRIVYIYIYIYERRPYLDSYNENFMTFCLLLFPPKAKQF